MRRILLVLAVTMAAAACPTGPTARNHPMLIQGRGAKVAVTLRRAVVQGELLEAADTGIVVLTERSMVLVPAGSIRALQFREVAGGYHDGPADSTLLRSVRRLARFPAGMPDRARADILNRLGQDSIRVERGR